MIVDDSAAFRNMIRQILSSDTLECIECQDGGQAVACYQESQPDWVLMDIQMRHMDGLEATRRIIGQFPKARVLVVSQHDDADWQSAAFSAGAIGFLSKENLSELPRILKATPSSNTPST